MLMSGIDVKVKNSSVQYIARQAILDAEQKIYSYELLYRDSQNNAFPVGLSDAKATGRLFFNSLMFIGLDRLAAGQKAFINLSDESLLNELPKLLKPTNLVIEIVERSENIPSLVNTVSMLRKQGYHFALDDYDGDEKWEPLLPLMDYFKLEAQDPLIKTSLLLKKLKRQFPKAKVIVERIEDFATFQYLKKAGCDLFQGYFFARPEMMNHGNIEPSKLIVLELLSATTKANLCFQEIQRMIAKDISLTARVLKLANARSGDGRLEMKSISQAVVYLGEDAIRQFVRVLALSELGVDKPTELTKMGLARANFLETFLYPGGPEMAEQGYLIGLMSILDAILEIDLAAIVAEFSLDSSLSSALMSYQGMLGGSLQLAVAVERNDWQEAENILLAIRPATPVHSLYEMALNARQYSDDIFATVSV